MSRLVILGCSATKRANPEPMRARDRYNGPLWQTLRAADPNESRARVMFLSARYGLKDADAPIADYNARLDRAAAERMMYAPDLVAELAELAQQEPAPFRDVAIVGGRLYLAVMRLAVKQAQAAGAIAEDAVVTEINGEIGYMRRDLRAWIEDRATPVLAGEISAPATTIEIVRDVKPATAAAIAALEAVKRLTTTEAIELLANYQAIRNPLHRDCIRTLARIFARDDQADKTKGKTAA